jgi:hypothetical protein
VGISAVSGTLLDAPFPGLLRAFVTGFWHNIRDRPTKADRDLDADCQSRIGAFEHLDTLWSQYCEVSQICF